MCRHQVVRSPAKANHDDNLQAYQSSWRSSAQSWLTVPAGILAMLAACFGVDKLLGIGGVSFPASVACLIVLFFALLLSELALGEHRTRRFVAIVDIPVRPSVGLPRTKVC